MKAHLAKLSLALLSTVFLLGCQDMGSEPVGPEGLGPEFNKPNSGNCGLVHCHGDEPGATLDLEFGMVFTGLPVGVTESDRKLTSNNGELMHVITMSFMKADGSAYEITDCVSQDDTTLDDDVLRGLVGELSGPTASKERIGIHIVIDKRGTGLTVGGPPTTSADHLLFVERDGTFDGETGTTGIKIGRKAHSNELTVQWISEDVFWFTGTAVAVSASDPNGRGGKFGRAISCDGGGAGTTNKVVVTFHR